MDDDASCCVNNDNDVMYAASLCTRMVAVGVLSVAPACWLVCCESHNCIVFMRRRGIPAVDFRYSYSDSNKSKKQALHVFHT